MNTHSKEKPFVCSHEGCDKSFTRNWYLKVHLETAHTVQVEEKNEEIWRKARKVSERSDHQETGDCLEKVKTLSGNRLHHCRFCDYVTNKKSNIKQHVKGVHKNLELHLRLRVYISDAEL